ncbi:MAG: hypothetical protein ACK4YQ_08200 [Phenylobacterium sp.]|uniref:hypothetical protein n=1 Tax=Phenylobacterium sp. TaxID=1871053 RepID=UPI003918A82C
MSADLPRRRYARRTFAFMGAYVAVNAAAVAGAFDDLRRPGAWVLGLAIAAPVAAQIWATLELMRQCDEFVRAVLAKRFIIASGVAMALFSAWGFLESYAQAPHAPGWLIYPLFWAAFGAVTPLVRTSR